jgi:hypothetical protein
LPEVPAAMPSPEVVRDRVETRDRRIGRALQQLTEDLTTIESAATLLSNEGSPMGRKVSLDLIRAQAWRAQWVLRAAAITDGFHQSVYRQRQIVSLLNYLRDGFAAECRLTGVRLVTEATDWNATVSVDDTALLAGIVGTIFATLGLLGPGQTEGAVIRVKVDAAEGVLRAVEVSQEIISVNNAVSTRFLDPSWADRPGGWTASLGAQTVKTVAQQSGGDVQFVQGEQRGSTVRLTMSA